MPRPYDFEFSVKHNDEGTDSAESERRAARTRRAATEAAARRIARGSGPDRLEARLRRFELRLLRRAGGWRADALLRRDCLVLPGGRAVDGRGYRAAGRARPGAGRLRRGRRGAMRLLYAGLPDRHKGAA